MKAILTSEAHIEGFGPVRQMGHVVDDVDAWMTALSHNQRLGPWMVMRNVTLPCTFRGEASRPKIHVALTYRGQMQIELIQPLNDAPSPYREVSESGRYGLHHTAHLVSHIDQATREAVAQGFEIVCDIRMMGARYVYLQKPEGGPYVEFLPASLMMRGMYRQGIAAARRWQGRGRPINIDLTNIGTILGSLPVAASAWWSQRRG